MTLNPRLYINAGRLIASKAGAAASPSTAHADKIFDSDWAYGGQLIAAGWADDPSTPVNLTNSIDATWDSSPWEISFPECGFIPVVTLANYWSPTYIKRASDIRGDGELSPMYWEWIYQGSASPYNTRTRYDWEVTSNKIIMTRKAAGSAYYRWRHAIYYQVFGLDAAAPANSGTFERLRLNADGLVISRPGFNATNNDVAHLVDPRFRQLEQHYQGTASSVRVDSGSGWSRHRATINFDELPYRPMVHFGMGWTSSGLGVTNDVVRYPEYITSSTTASSIIPGGKYKNNPSSFWAEATINSSINTAGLFTLRATIYKADSGLEL